MQSKVWLITLHSAGDEQVIYVANADYTYAVKRAREATELISATLKKTSSVDWRDLDDAERQQFVGNIAIFEVEAES